MKLRNNGWLTTAILSLGTFVFCLNQGMAAEASAISPTGTWKITTINPQTKSRIGSEETLKIKREAGKLTGTITHRSSVNGNVRVYESVIKEIKLQGSEISFTYSHPPHVGEGPDATYSYRGNIIGDTIKGKMEQEWSGHTSTKDWEAKRVKE